MLFAAFLCAAAVRPWRGVQAQQVADRGAVVSGFVRDSAGLPQMGALVQILAPDARIIASGITDLRGRYRISDLLPGNYHVRATAALFLPAERANLHLRIGSRSIVDLTLATLTNVSGWLPAQRRGADEPGDDWMWTLRSSANRPVLRVLDDQGKSVQISTSGSENRRNGNSMTDSRVAVTSDDGGFGHGGVHQTLTVNRLQADGSSQILRAEFSGARTPYPVAPSVDVAGGLQSRTGQFGTTRTLFTYHSHPEFIGRNGVAGMQASSLRTAQRMELGDTLLIDAGSMLRDVNMGGNAVSMLPFVRVSVKPASNVVLTYGYATSEEMQSLDDLDRVQVEVPVAFSVGGKLTSPTARHQEVELAANAGRTVMEIALYNDEYKSSRIAGTGVLTPDEIAGGQLVADPTTQSFRAMGAGYHASGYRAEVRQQLTPSLTLAGRYEAGTALETGHPDATDVHSVLAALKRTHSQAATVALRGRILRTGTRIRTAYRWQPEDTLTAVDSFGASAAPAYFSVHLRQPLRVGHLLPNHVEAVVDVTNLLAQGYQAFVSSDGRTLYFAQAPKVLQAGLSFSF